MINLVNLWGYNALIRHRPCFSVSGGLSHSPQLKARCSIQLYRSFHGSFLYPNPDSSLPTFPKEIRKCFHPHVNRDFYKLCL